MKAQVISLDNKKEGEVTLNKDIFGCELRKDILHRVVTWQRARKQAGTHKTKTISEISGTTKKPFAQKGTGNARQGSLRSAQMRGGATMFGPQVRTHNISLNKKIRKLALKTAISTKHADGNLVIIKDIKLKDPKTKALADKITKLGWKTALIIDGDKVDENFSKASRNLYKIDSLPTIGANVYDILNHEKLVITEEGLKKLEERLA